MKHRVYIRIKCIHMIYHQHSTATTLAEQIEQCCKSGRKSGIPKIQLYSQLPAGKGTTWN